MTVATAFAVPWSGARIERTIKFGARCDRAGPCLQRRIGHILNPPISKSIPIMATEFYISVTADPPPSDLTI
jgi:hypothetical protein